MCLRPLHESTAGHSVQNIPLESSNPGYEVSNLTFIAELILLHHTDWHYTHKPKATNQC